MTKQEFLERARNTHGYKYEYPTLTDKILSNQDIDIVFNGIRYKQKVVKHILLGRCPEKNTPLKTTKSFISEAKLIWGDKYDYSLVEYKGALNKVQILYCRIIFEQVAISHLRGNSPELNMNQEYFIEKSKEKWGMDKYDYSMVKYVTAHEKVKIIYNGMIYEQTPTAHLLFAPEKKIIIKTTEQFISEAKLIHDNMYSYEKTIYTLTKNKLTITCPIHGDFEQKALSHLQGSGCPFCNESKGEKEIVKILKKYKINFERQKKFPDCKNVFQLPFDFYIPSLRILIEYDGEQHYSALSFFGGEKAFNQLKINDKIKNDYCEDNYINLIRIRYDEIDNVETILNKSLTLYGL